MKVIYMIMTVHYSNVLKVIQNSLKVSFFKKYYKSII